MLQIIGLIFSFWVAFRIVSFVLKTFCLPKTNWKTYGTENGGWALVTGGTDGIGKEFALQLARKGLNIFLVARNKAKLEAVQKQIENENTSSKVEYYMADFSDNSLDFGALVKSLSKKKLHVLVNNVGMSHVHPEYFSEANEDHLVDMININILNTVKITKAILPLLQQSKDNKGQSMILNIGSFSGQVPIPLLQTYSACKSFLKTWSLALAQELDSSNIKVQLLNTYFVVSNMSKIKRSSFMIPTAQDYVKCALENAGQIPFYSPFPAHALLSELMDIVPDQLMNMLNMKQMTAVRKYALRKKLEKTK